MTNNLFAEKSVQVVVNLNDLREMVRELVSEFRPMETASAEPKLFTRKEAADMLQLSLPTFDKIMDAQGIERIKLGGRKIYFRADDILKIIKSGANLKYVRR